jgi:biopolymer transport protein ExbD
MRLPSHGQVSAESHGIDLAPMLDFVVNLLIFFIITAVFIKQAGIGVYRPNGATLDPVPVSKPVVIDESGEVSIDLRPIDLRAVRAHVEQFRAAGATAALVIADQGAPTGIVVAVADQIRLGGINDITFTTTLLQKPQSID